MQGLASAVQIQESLDVGEVVAQGTVTAGHADVIGVEARVVVRGGLHEVAVVIGRHAGIRVLLAGLGHLHAGRNVRHHLRVGLFRHGLDVVGVVHRHLRVVLVLDNGISEAVAHTHAGEIDVDALFVVVALEDTGGNGRGVVTTVALAEDEEVVGHILGVGSEELLQELVHVFADRRFVLVVLGTVRVSDARRLVNPHDVGITVPRVGVVVGGETILADCERRNEKENEQLKPTVGRSNARLTKLPLQGPFSVRRASCEEHPGPPVSQITRGSVEGLDLDSKNQKK